MPRVHPVRPPFIFKLQNYLTIIIIPCFGSDDVINLSWALGLEGVSAKLQHFYDTLGDII